MYVFLFCVNYRENSMTRHIKKLSYIKTMRILQCNNNLQRNKDNLTLKLTKSGK